MSNANMRTEQKIYEQVSIVLGELSVKKPVEEQAYNQGVLAALEWVTKYTNLQPMSIMAKAKIKKGK